MVQISVPIPHFDTRSPAQRRLAELGCEAQQEAQRIAPTLASFRLLGRQRSAMRGELATILEEIDGIVRKLLENPNS